MSNLSDYSSVVIAGITAVSTLGSGIAFVWARLEYTNKKTQIALKKCEEREQFSRERRAALTTVIELLWQEIKRLSPASEVLRRSKRLLDDIRHKEFESTHDEEEV
jgi:hypothetical protein